MGSNLARNLASREGNTVAIFNRSHDKTVHADRRAPRGRLRCRPRRTRSSPRRCSKPRTAIIMVKAGAGTDAVIDELVDVFEPGDIIVDGGNALFTDTIRREKAVRETGHQLRRRRHLRRRGGRAARPVDHARRLGRVVGDPRPDPEVASPRSPRASRASPTSATTAPATS